MMKGIVRGAAEYKNQRKSHKIPPASKNYAVKSVLS